MLIDYDLSHASVPYHRTRNDQRSPCQYFQSSFRTAKSASEMLWFQQRLESGDGIDSRREQDEASHQHPWWYARDGHGSSDLQWSAHYVGSSQTHRSCDTAEERRGEFQPGLIGVFPQNLLVQIRDVYEKALPVSSAGCDTHIGRGPAEERADVNHGEIALLPGDQARRDQRRAPFVVWPRCSAGEVPLPPAEEDKTDGGSDEKSREVCL